MQNLKSNKLYRFWNGETRLLQKLNSLNSPSLMEIVNFFMNL